MCAPTSLGIGCYFFWDRRVSHPSPQILSSAAKLFSSSSIAKFDNSNGFEWAFMLRFPLALSPPESIGNPPLTSITPTPHELVSHQEILVLILRQWTVFPWHLMQKLEVSYILGGHWTSTWLHKSKSWHMKRTFYHFASFYSEVLLNYLYLAKDLFYVFTFAQVVTWYTF